MSDCEESRWQEECFGPCADCTVSCLRGDNYNDGNLDSFSKRFVTVGSVRYGLRLGAVSPPPPGAGPRYRSQCCWSSTLVPGSVSRIPLLNESSAINSNDIFSCVNRVRIAENATSEQSEQATVRDQVLYSTKSLLKNQLQRRALVRPQLYAHLCECGDCEEVDITNTLDRLPRFRFGGNRGSINSKIQERDKRNNEQRLKEVTERLKRAPIPPPRTRHVSTRVSLLPPPTTTRQRTGETNENTSPRILPLRSVSFSQVEYSTDDKKYVRRRHPVSLPQSTRATSDNFNRGAITLPRPKNTTAGCATNLDKQKSSPVATSIERPSSDAIDGKRINENAIIEDTLTKDNNYLKTETKKVQDVQETKRDKSRRRKGMYISQWPNNYQPIDNVISDFGEDGDFAAFVNTNSQQSTATATIDNSSQKDSDKIDLNKLTDPIKEKSVTTSWTKANNNDNSTLTDLTETKDKNKKHLPRADSLSEGEPESSDKKTDNLHLGLSDVSDCESRINNTDNTDNKNSRTPRRYSKRPLRGPYGQMLEAEMKKPDTGRKLYGDLKFLDDISSEGISGTSEISLSTSNSVGAGDPKPKYVIRMRGSSNHSLDDSQIKNSLSASSLTPLKFVPMLVKRKVSADSVSSNDRNDSEQKLVISHQRTTSSPSKLEGLTSNHTSNELLEQLLAGSTEQLLADTNLQRSKDTRTHVVVELYDTERSYVESLQILITKYLEPLKSPENAGLLDASLVDEIFFQIPFLLSHHQVFLEELKKRLEHWDVKQKVGDVFLDMFSKPTVIENYTNYVNNWKRTREIIKNAQQSKPAFSRFLEAMAREHKGKLALDSLLIKPIQKFPKYELLLQRLIKHTDTSHPDHSLLLAAQKEVHEQLLKINCTEREALELEQLREIEGLIEGLIELVASDRQYIRHDLVSMVAGGGTRKERALFLFSDLLLVTSIKRRSGTIKRPTTGQGSVTSTLEANKYKLLMKIALDDLEIVRSKDENLRHMMHEIDNVTEDIGVLNQINELSWSLHCNHGPLDDIIKDMLGTLNKQLAEQQNSDSQMSCLDLTLNTTNGLENISIIYSKPDRKSSWEESFNEAKHKLAMSGDRRPYPELVATVPIRKTRAGLQFTCAAPTMGDNGKDVWVCNSDGYVGQVCILSLQPEPTVTSCNGVCNARILCVASVPGISYNPPLSNKCDDHKEESKEHKTIQFDSSSSSDDEYERSDEEHEEMNKSLPTVKSESVSIDSDDADSQQSTMWLGTEDGCIHVYNSSDNIRIKKNKIKLQHGSSILCIIYLNNRVYVSLANGDIAIYERDASGGWNVSTPISVSIGTTQMPVSKMLPNGGKLWCGCGNTVKVFNTETLVTESNFTVNSDCNKPITCIILSGNGVWLSLQNSAIVKCFHALSFEPLYEVNVAPAVTKMLTSCDDIIRQHKAACLRVTSLLACKDLLWIGTSAGVLLTMPLPHITSTTTKISATPVVAGVPHGHTGHVRFLTYVEWQTTSFETSLQRHSYKGKTDQRNNSKVLVISGGDGYEDFRSTNISEVAGREDSTNHLLLWHI